jgi:hypothetical protein
MPIDKTRLDNYPEYERKYLEDIFGDDIYMKDEIFGWTLVNELMISAQLFKLPKYKKLFNNSEEDNANENN